MIIIYIFIYEIKKKKEKIKKIILYIKCIQKFSNIQKR